MASASDGLRARWEQISEREQRLIIVLGITFVVVIVAWAGMQINDRLNQLEARNHKMRKALAALQAFRAEGGAIPSGPNIPIPETPEKLESYLSGIADEIGITIPAFQPRTPIMQNEFTETSTSIELRNLTLSEATAFMEKVESKSRVVVIKTMHLKTNFRDKEKLQLEMVVATYSRTPHDDKQTEESEEG